MGKHPKLVQLYAVFQCSLVPGGLGMVDGSSGDGGCGNFQKGGNLVAFPDLMDRECCVSEWMGEWVAKRV